MLEHNSCRPEQAKALAKEIQTQDLNPKLQDYLEKVLDCFGIDTEIHSKSSFVIHPGPQTDLSAFPGLTEEGATITYDRDTALINEDMQFLTWEHGMVRGAMDLILGNEQGNTALCAIKNKNIAAGTLLLEAIYILESSAEEKMHVSRYLPPTTIQILVDLEGNELSEILPHEFINKFHIPVKKDVAAKIVKSHKKEIKQLVVNSETIVHEKPPALLDEARGNVQALLQGEIKRLEALRQVNPNIREEEIDFFTSLLSSVNVVLDATQPRLDALRIIVAT